MSWRDTIRMRLETTLVKDTALYTITDAMGKAMSFLLLPLISKYLLPDQLAIATNFTVVATIVSLLSGLAIVNSLPYFFYEQTKAENRRLISNILMLTLAMCLLLGIVIVLCNEHIYRLLQIGLEFQLMAVVYVVFTIVCNISMQLYRLEEKPRVFAVLQLSQVALMCALVVALVVGFKMGGRGKVLADTATFAVMGLVHLMLIVRRGYLSLRFDHSEMRRILKFGIPLLPHSLSFWLKGGADKIIVTNLIGMYANGIYSMALSISSIYTLFSNAFFNAFTPYLMRRLSMMTPENEYTEKCRIVRLLLGVVLLFGVVSVFTVGVAWLVLHFFVNERYIQALALLPGIIMSLYIYIVYSLMVQFVYKQKKTVVLGLITFSGALIQMLVSWALVCVVGLHGVVYSSIIGSLLVGGLMMAYSQHVYPLPWLGALKWKRSK